MKSQDGNEALLAYEAKVEEMVSLTFDVCEKRLASTPKAVEPPRTALTSAAMCVRDSLKTFLAVTKLPDGEREKR